MPFARLPRKRSTCSRSIRLIENRLNQPPVDAHRPEAAARNNSSTEAK